MRTIWVCDVCDNFEPCYIVNDSTASPCRVCSDCKWKRIEGVTNIKLTYDEVKHVVIN